MALASQALYFDSSKVNGVINASLYLISGLFSGTFRDAYIPTIEDTYRQVISSNKNVCTLQITDTTGSHQFPAMQRLNITKGHAFMLVFRYITTPLLNVTKSYCNLLILYSITSKQSMEELIPIYREILEVKQGEENLPIILVGNKCDEDAQRDVSHEYSNEMVAKILKGCGFIETSAKTGHNVPEAFQVSLSNTKLKNPITI